MAASGEIERDLIPVTRLDDDDIDELHAAHRFASRSAYFGQHVAGQRALKNMHCTMLFRAVLTRGSASSSGRVSVDCWRSSPTRATLKELSRRRRRRLRAKQGR
jgi:hypothetical protein